jgi:hypothetical protein
MNEQQRLCLVQARTDFAVFELLRKEVTLPPCHALHYLQMATELLGKAYAWKRGPIGKRHQAFVSFLKSLRTNRLAQQRLGFQGKNENWQHMLRKSVSLAHAIEVMAPTLAKDGPNPEYPWPPGNPNMTPAEHPFDIWQKLTETAAGRQFMGLLKDLFEIAESFV